MNSNATDSNGAEAGTLDADSGPGEDIPAELSAKVESFFRHLVEGGIQVHREGRWKLLKRRATFGGPPPDVSADEVCVRIMAIARQDIEEYGEPDDLRARLKLNLAGTTTFRYATLRSVIEADGRLGFADGVSVDNEMGALKDAKSIVIDVLTEGRKQVESLSKMGAAMAEFVTGCVGIAQAYGTGDAERIRAMMDFRKMELDHEEEMESTKQLGKIGEKVAPALMAKFFGVKVETEAKAAQLKACLDRLTDEKRQAALGILGDKGSELLDVLLKSESDDVFDARAQALVTHIASLGPAKAKGIMDGLAELFSEEDREKVGQLLFGEMMG